MLKIINRLLLSNTTKSLSPSLKYQSSSKYLKIHPQLSFSRIKSHRRNFFGFADLLSSRKSYTGHKLIGYSQNQLYEVVSKIDEYPLFVPFCTSSEILNIQSIDHKTTTITAALGVGFQGFSEIYVSEVTCESPRFVQAVASSDVLFRHLVAIWNFTPYVNDDENVVEEEETTHCILDFRVEFEFSSPLHLQVANIFSDQVNELMITAFEQRCSQLYGPPAS